MCAAGQIFMKQNAPQARLIKQYEFLLSPHGYYDLKMQYVIVFPQITPQNLLLLINLLMN